MTTKNLFAGLGALSLLIGLGACSQSGGTSVATDRGPADQPPCMTERTAGNAPTVAILVQPTASPRARTSTIDTVLAGAANERAHVVVLGVGADAGERVATTLASEANNTSMRAAEIECKTDALRAEVLRLSAGRVTGGANVVAAAGTLARSIKEDTGPVHVVALTNALQQGDGVDLERSADLDDPVHSVNTLSSGALTSCDDWRVAMVTPSVAGGSAAYARLRDWWKHLVDRCGGKLMAFGESLDRFPLRKALPPSVYTQVRFEVSPPQQGVVTATIGSEALFPTGSAALTSRAQALLRDRLLPVLARAHGTIRVDGHTDAQGQPAVNEPLSRRRAASVRAWIVRHAGLPARRVRTKGWGERRPIAENTMEAGRQRNRRVEVRVRVG